MEHKKDEDTFDEDDRYICKGRHKKNEDFYDENDRMFFFTKKPISIESNTFIYEAGLAKDKKNSKRKSPSKIFLNI